MSAEVDSLIGSLMGEKQGKPVSISKKISRSVNICSREVNELLE